MNGSSFWFYGDPHGDFSPLLEAITLAFRRGTAPEAVVLLGDMDLIMPLEQVLAGPIRAGVAVWWIPGNHDFDQAGRYHALYDNALAENNLHGRVTVIGGLRIAGLGGVFRGRIWYPPDAPRFQDPEELLRTLSPRDHWLDGLPLHHRASIFWQDYAALWEQRADVLVCHEAPGCHRHGFSAIDELAEAMGASLIVHGHHHVYYQTKTNNGIDVMGVGMCGIARLDGEVIVPGKLDARRKGRWRAVD